MSLDLSYYHSTDEILQAFTRLSDPARCGSRVVVDNLHDAEDPAFGLRIATFSDDILERISQAPSAKPHVLLNFGAHGRELISSEVALRLASMLCGEAPSRFEDGSPERSSARITELLRRVVIKMVPVQVPSSRSLAEVGSGSCIQRRLNRRGVDVNRNWDVAWAEGDSAQGSSQYRGPRPFSEPETRVLARLAGEWRPDLFVDVRSGDRYIAMPYSSRSAGPSDKADKGAMLDAMRSVTSMLARTHRRLLAMGGIPYGPASSLGEEPYRATGTALDYMYERAGVRRSYMLEVYGASTVYGVAGRKEKEIARTPTAVASFLEYNASVREPMGHSRRRRRILPARQQAPVRGGLPLRPTALIDVAAEEATGGAPLVEQPKPMGLTAGLAREESPFDCVAFFNPTTFADYEATVNGWADALLVFINASVTGNERRVSLEVQ